MKFPLINQNYKKKKEKNSFINFHACNASYKNQNLTSNYLHTDVLKRISQRNNNLKSHKTYKLKVQPNKL